jgi:hypothetical protein
MKSSLSQTVLRAVQRIVDAPEQTLSRVAARFGTELELDPNPSPAPDHLMVQLESVFDALSELPFQPDITAALNLACDALQAELPSGAIAAGLYDINADEVRIVTARGMEDDLLRGMIMTRGRCFAGRTTDAPFVINGGPSGADWLGSGDDDSQVLLCPVASDAHLLGVLAVADPVCIDRFGDHDLELVSYVAGQLASFIQAIRQRPSIPAPMIARRA